ncbi:MAG: hypothetical protein Q4D54_09890 [Eubacteriales bacterium]|nr:hypothetical protein [Lachnospiraceae bacterium]MDO5128040.1 hypothetical protein [Eubacteriales bacterium]
MQKKVSSFVFGSIIGALFWLLMMISDAIDEYVFNEGCMIGMGAVFAVPVIAFVWYFIWYIKKKPAGKSVLSRLSGFVIMSGLGAILILPAVNDGRFFIEQKHRGYFDLNGIEYFCYAIIAIGGFIVLCAIFHLVYFIITLVKTSEQQTHPH